ncbi:MerR family transcriptional regulator [Conexibacter stalactiti]|uniref:MerR family transcriptional regulator n=1 Tax=Conexibacter stalactiti TaxID=1940611 RepID=A0ABU4HX16_9ACTN|nr:MerR family transcriptional regulator [Conexibacter stalactiti]MDW5597763.1 MerR family transcriptional regulator [Conexibacter stalactiti]MEC5038405.1 MerR family transcriptional regulator [Conexibacter stalactiti]
MSDQDPAAWMTIGELARRTGVSTDLLRAWERRYGLLAPRRTTTNRRLYSGSDALRVSLMQRYLAAGVPAAAAAERVCATTITVDVGAGPAIAPHEVAAAHAELRTALDAFEETAAQRVLERLFAAHSRLAVVRDVLLPYLRELGDRWEAGSIDVAQEHFASTFAEARFMAMARGWDRGPGPRALLACPAGERHTFGLTAFGIALHARGWRIVYLGADTPAAMVAAAADTVPPDLVVLAAVSPARFDDERAALRTLATRWSCRFAGAGASDATSARLGGRHLAEDPITAATIVAAG